MSNGKQPQLKRVGLHHVSLFVASAMNNLAQFVPSTGTNEVSGARVAAPRLISRAVRVVVKPLTEAYVAKRRAAAIAEAHEALAQAIAEYRAAKRGIPNGQKFGIN